MELDEFAGRLEAMIGRPTQYRPFVCDGSPLDCRIFIVGINPATAMAADFWDFWGPTGFNKSAWRVEYERERRETPPKSGKKFKPRISPTRRIMDLIESQIKFPVLETNLFSTPTVSAAELTDWNRAPFEFLVRTIRPSLIIAHGKTVRGPLRELSLDCKVEYVDHFSRGWSHQCAREFGREIAERCSGWQT